jgi:hypothetical protein
MLTVNMLTVIMLNVIILSVVAPIVYRVVLPLSDSGTGFWQENPQSRKWGRQYPKFLSTDFLTRRF